MNPRRKRRLIMISLAVAGVSVSIGLVLLALQENINLFFSPSQVAAAEVPAEQHFRIGGLVVPGSVEKTRGKLAVAFKLSDTVNEVQIEYDGILPDLFREGQGIVAEGRLNQRGVFIADRVLAKHDENYMPPEVEQALKMSGNELYSGETR